MDVYLMREVPRRSLVDSRNLLGSVYVNKVFLGIVVFVIISSTAILLESPDSELFAFVILAGLVTILRTYWMTFSAVLRATNRVRSEAWLFTASRPGFCHAASSGSDRQCD